jgi:lysozyme
VRSWLFIGPTIALLIVSPGRADSLQPTELVDDVPREALFELALPAEAETRREMAPFALKKEFWFPHDAVVDDSTGKDRTDALFGIDISHYQKKDLDFSTLAQQNVRFVYVKASQGRSYDGLFAYNWTALSQTDNVARGAYHFLSADPNIDGRAQADTFLNVVSKTAGLKAGDMPPAADLEWDVPPGGKAKDDRWLQRQPDDIVQTVLDYLNRVKEKTGRTPLLYTNLTWWRGAKIPVSEFKRLAGFKVWVFDYRKPNLTAELPEIPKGFDYTIWQFTNQSHLNRGYPRNLDASKFDGDEAGFRKVMLSND